MAETTMKAETIEELKELVLEEFRSRGTEYDVTVVKTQKENMEMTAITVKAKGSNVGPTMYLETLMGVIESGHDQTDAINQFVDTLIKHVTDQGMDVEWLRDYEAVKSKLGFRIVNANFNPEYMESVIYEMTEYEDLALIPAIRMDMGTDGQGSVVVTRRLLDVWDVDEKTVIEKAKANEPINDPMKEYAFPLPPEIFGVMPSFRIWTNESYCGGAKVIVYPQFKEMLDKDYPEGAYIIPCSKHEIICLGSLESFGDEDEIEKIRDMIGIVNSSTVSEADVLSNHLYGYKDGKVRSW